MTDETLLEFPCRFPIKIFTRAEVDLHPLVMEIVAPHAEGLTADDISFRASSKGNFIAVTVTINAVSKQQLDTIYLALTAHDDVLSSM